MVEKTEKTRVTTETVDVYICPSCNQKYEIHEMVNIGLGTNKSKGRDDVYFENVSMMCENCADSIFDYDTEEGNITNDEIIYEELQEKYNNRKKIDVWLGILILSVVTHFTGWLIGIINGDVNNLSFSMIMISWISLPIALLADMFSSNHSPDSSMRFAKIALILGSFVWLLNIFTAILYIFIRNKL